MFKHSKTSSEIGKVREQKPVQSAANEIALNNARWEGSDYNKKTDHTISVKERTFASDKLKQSNRIEFKSKPDSGEGSNTQQQGKYDQHITNKIKEYYDTIMNLLHENQNEEQLYQRICNDTNLGIQMYNKQIQDIPRWILSAWKANKHMNLEDWQQYKDIVNAQHKLQQEYQSIIDCQQKLYSAVPSTTNEERVKLKELSRKNQQLTKLYDIYHKLKHGNRLDDTRQYSQRMLNICIARKHNLEQIKFNLLFGLNNSVKCVSTSQDYQMNIYTYQSFFHSLDSIRDKIPKASQQILANWKLDPDKNLEQREEYKILVDHAELLKQQYQTSIEQPHHNQSNEELQQTLENLKFAAKIQPEHPPEYKILQELRHINQQLQSYHDIDAKLEQWNSLHIILPDMREKHKIEQLLDQCKSTLKRKTEEYLEQKEKAKKQRQSQA